jgi:hypothetical protein
MENENHSPSQSGSGPRQNAFDLEDLNRRHVSSTDKWYRMCAGAGSEITGFEDGTIYLSIVVDERQQRPLEEIVGKIARSWLHNKELKNASQYIAVIFQTDGRLGALVNPRAATSRQLTHELLNNIRPKKQDAPITVISGDLCDTNT